MPKRCTATFQLCFLYIYYFVSPPLSVCLIHFIKISAFSLSHQLLIGCCLLLYYWLFLGTCPFLFLCLLFPFCLLPAFKIRHTFLHLMKRDLNVLKQVVITSFYDGFFPCAIMKYLVFKSYIVEIL